MEYIGIFYGILFNNKLKLLFKWHLLFHQPIANDMTVHLFCISMFLYR